MDFTDLAPIVIPVITSGIIASAVNTLVTLGVQFIPGIRVWFAGLTSDAKRTFFAVLTISVGVAVFAYSLVSPEAQEYVGLVIPLMKPIVIFLSIGGALASLPFGESILAVLPETLDVAEAKAARPEDPR